MVPYFLDDREDGLDTGWASHQGWVPEQLEHPSVPVLTGPDFSFLYFPNHFQAVLSLT